MSSAITGSAISVKRIEGEVPDSSGNEFVPAIRFFGSVDPRSFLLPRKFGFYPVFRGDLLALQIQKNSFVFQCDRENKAYCSELHLDFLSYSEASILHAVLYKELRVRVWNERKNLVRKMVNLPLGCVVHIKRKEISSIPIEAILRCRVAIKTPECNCDCVLFGVELKEHRNSGDCDGMFLGERFFTCDENCGLYVSIEQLVDICIDDSLYKKALSEESAATTLIKMTFVGAEGAGKTSLIRTLLGKPFRIDESATIGAYFTRAMSLLKKRLYVDSDDSLTYSQLHSIEWQEIETSEVNSLINSQFNSKISEAVEKHKELSVSSGSSTVNSAEAMPITELVHSSAELQPCAVDDNVFVAKEDQLSDLEVSMSSKDLREAAYGMKRADQIRFVLSDYGGHLIFHNFHLLFTSEDDVITITVDASQDLDSAIIPRERCDYLKQKRKAAGMLTPLQTIHLWLQSIHARAKRPQGADNLAMSRIYPTVLIVATHVSWLFFQKYQFIEKIRATLIDKPYAQHLPEDNELAFHFIDNKHRWLFRKSIVGLKYVLVLSARHLLQKRHPVCYLKFEKTILEKVEGNIERLTLHETYKIAISCGITSEGDIKSTDFLEALTHFTNKGVLLFYPDIPPLADTVFISPQWLANVFSCIITTHKLVDSGDPFRHAWMKYDKCGILDERFLNYILERSDNLDNKSLILGLFEKFSLAAKIPNTTRFTNDSLEVHETGDTYLVPSLLMDDPSYRDIFNFDVYKTGLDYVSVAFYFPDKFVPECTMNQLLVKCIQWNVHKEYRLERILYGYGHFRLGGNQFYWLKTVQLSDQSTDAIIQLAISNIEPIGSVDVQSLHFHHRLELLEYVSESLREIMDASMPAATKPVIHVICPHCSGPKPIEPHLPLLDISLNDPVVCSKTGKIVAKEHYYCFVGKLLTESRNSVQITSHELLSSPHPHPVTHRLSTDTAESETVSCFPHKSIGGIVDNKFVKHSDGLLCKHPSDQELVMKTLPSVPFGFILEQRVTMAAIPLITSPLAVHWEAIAYILVTGEDSIGDIETIKATHASPGDCFMAVIQKWISGSSGKSPKIWGTFKSVVDSLNINFSENIEPKLLDHFRGTDNNTAHMGDHASELPAYQCDKVTMNKVPLLSKLLAPHWMSIAYLLDLDDYGSAVQLIKCNHTKQEDCFSALLKEWISGNKGIKPKTWQTFVKVLTDMKLDVSKVQHIISTN